LLVEDATDEIRLRDETGTGERSSVIGDFAAQMGKKGQ